MESIVVDEIPATAEPVQVTDQIFVQEEGTRVLEPEMHESQPKQQQTARSEFDITKLSFELQQGYRIYKELLSDSNRNVTWPFLDPVDADSLGLWDYYERIKQPMCFTTIGSKFTDSKYTSITEVIADIRRILENCYRYNGPSHWVSKLGQKLEKILEQKLALLNRSLREKVTLSATMTVTKGLPLNEFEAVSGRRRSSRQNYLSMANGENSSSLVNQLKIIEEAEEKERRRQREKEKKEANQALLQDLLEWEEKELTAETINQLHSMWEIPSVGSLLYMVRDIIGVEDINLTEFELSFVYPNKSSLLARIFTALLITPHQRKSIYKRPAMKFKLWESKLKEKLDVWYKVLEKDGGYMVSLHFGIELKFFDILGSEKNPLEEKSYLDLTVHQRVWVLKALTDVCFHKDYDIRDRVNACDMMEQRELFLGSDADEYCYIYFPIFQTTDLRVYRHDPLEVPSLEPEEEPAPPTPPPPSPPPPPPPTKKRTRRTPVRSCTPRSARLRQLRSNAGKDEEMDEDSSTNQETQETQTNQKDKLPIGNKIQADEEPKEADKISKEEKIRCNAEKDVDMEESTPLKQEQEMEINQDDKLPEENKKQARIEEGEQGAEGGKCQNNEEEHPEEAERLNDGQQDNEKQKGNEDKEKVENESLESKDKTETKEEEVKPPPPVFKSEDGFHMACHDIETLKALAEKFAEPSAPPPPPPKKRGRRPRPPNPRKRCVVDLHETLLALLQELEKYEGAFSRNYIKAKIKIMKESQEPEPIEEPEPEPEPEETQEDWGSEISDDDAGAKNDAKDEDFRIEDEYQNPGTSEKKDEAEQSVSDSDEGSCAGIQTNPLSKRKRRLPKDEESSSNNSISVQTPALKIRKKPKKWSPCKEKFFPTASASASSPVPAVVISATNAEESLKATDSSSKAAPDKILLSALEHALKKAKEHACQDKSQTTEAKNVSSGLSTALPTGNTVSPRKRVLVSPEGKTHEIKPSFHMISSNPIPISTTLPSHPPIQRKSDLLNAVSAKTGTITVTIGPQGIKTTSKVQTTPKVHPMAPLTTHQRPNILSKSKKQQVVNPKTGSPAQAASIVSSNQTYRIVTQDSSIAGSGKINNDGKSSKMTYPTSQTKVIMTKDGTTKIIPTNKTVKTGSANPNTTKSQITLKTQQGTQPVTSQTKILFIPASSVDAKSPLASFKPQMITTTSGQNIYGYAVVMPPGSAQEVNAVINSSLKKPFQPSLKQGLNLVQGKPSVAVSHVKSSLAETQGKSTTVSLQGKPTVKVLQGRPIVSESVGKPLSLGQGKPVVGISQAKVSLTGTQGKPTTGLSQVKPTVVLAQGKPATSVPHGIPAALIPQGKSNVTISKELSPVSPEKPTVKVLQGKPTVAVSQGQRTVTISRENCSIAISQGKPIVTVSNGTVVTGHPDKRVLHVGNTVVPINSTGVSSSQQNKAASFSSQGASSTANGQAKQSISLLQATPQSKPTTYLIQGKPSTTSLQGKSVPNVLQGNPAVSLLLSQNSANLQGNPVSTVQGKPVFAILQGKPNDGKAAQLVVGSSNVTALLNSLGKLQTAMPTIAQVVITSKNQPVSCASTVQSRPAMTTTLPIQLASNSTISGVIAASTVLGTAQSTTAPSVQTLAGTTGTTPTVTTKTPQPSCTTPKTLAEGVSPETGKLNLLQLAKSRILASTGDSASSSQSSPCLINVSTAIPTSPSKSRSLVSNVDITQSCVTSTSLPQPQPGIQSTASLVESSQPHFSVTSVAGSAQPQLSVTGIVSVDEADNSPSVATSADGSIQTPSGVISVTSSVETHQPHSDSERTHENNLPVLQSKKVEESSDVSQLSSLARENSGDSSTKQESQSNTISVASTESSSKSNFSLSEAVDRPVQSPSAYIYCNGVAQHESLQDSELNTKDYPSKGINCVTQDILDPSIGKTIETSKNITDRTISLKGLETDVQSVTSASRPPFSDISDNEGRSLMDDTSRDSTINLASNGLHSSKDSEETCSTMISTVKCATVNTT